MPALGRPTSAASARSLRRSSISRSSPGMPTSAKRGVWRLGPAKCLLPRPPVPPFATTTRAPARARSETSSSPSKTCVPTGTREHRVVAARAVRELSAATAAATGAQLLVRPEAGEVAPPQIGHEHDVAAVAAVAAVRPAARYVLLPPEVDRAVTAATRDGRQARAVVEHAATRASTTEMKRRSPLVRNATLPSRIAKIVSSLPIPAAGAGAEARAALADEDHPRRHVLAGEELHAEHLRVRVAAVPRRAESLLMRH